MVSAAVAGPGPGAAAVESKRSSGEVTIKLWPPGSRTRSHIAQRMSENLRSLSSLYTPLDENAATSLAGRIEELAFQEGEREWERAGVNLENNNGSSAVRIYAKEASRIMLAALRAGGKLPDSSAVDEKQESSITSVAPAKDVEVDTAASTKGDELFDISSTGPRAVLSDEKAEELFNKLATPGSCYTQIRLSNWGFTKEAAQVAAAALAKIKTRLKKADLSDIVAGRPEVEALEVMTILSSALEGSNLSHLNLSDNALGEKGVRAFSALLKSQHHLEELLFVNNGISPEAAKAIVELVPSGKSLKKLHFHNNLSRDRGAEVLSKLVRDATNLEDLRFSSSRVETAGGKALAAALRAGSSLRALDFRDNMFGPEGGLALGSSLKQQAELKELYLADLGLHDEGIQAIMEALQDSAPHLSVLDVGNNDMTPRGASYVAKCIEKKRSLTKLSLAENEIKNKGVIIVSGALKQDHDKLETLDFTLTEIGDEGALAAAKAVVNKQGFKTLVLESNHISAKGLAALKELLDSGIGSSVLAEMEDNEGEDEEEEEMQDEEEEVGDSEELQARMGDLQV